MPKNVWALAVSRELREYLSSNNISLEEFSSKIGVQLSILNSVIRGTGVAQGSHVYIALHFLAGIKAADPRKIPPFRRKSVHDETYIFEERGISEEFYTMLSQVFSDEKILMQAYKFLLELMSDTTKMEDFFKNNQNANLARNLATLLALRDKPHAIRANILKTMQEE